MLDSNQVQDWCSTCMLGLIQKKDLAERESQASDSVLIVKHGKPPQLCRKSPISLSNQDTLIQTIMDIVIRWRWSLKLFLCINSTQKRLWTACGHLQLIRNVAFLILHAKFKATIKSKPFLNGIVQCLLLIIYAFTWIYFCNSSSLIIFKSKIIISPPPRYDVTPAHTFFSFKNPLHLEWYTSQ